MLEKTKINEKDDGVGPFFLKKLGFTLPPEFSTFKLVQIGSKISAYEEKI